MSEENNKSAGEIPANEPEKKKELKVEVKDGREEKVEKVENTEKTSTNELEEKKELKVEFESIKEDSEEKITVAQAFKEEKIDWNGLSNEDKILSPKESDEITQQYDETLLSINEKEVVEGTIVSMNKREAVVDINFKSEGIININEFRYNPELKPGDKIKVYIETQEDAKGQLILSHKKARALRAWEKINSALENDEVVEGYVMSRTKGGMIVDVFGIETFLPGSQIDIKPIRDYDVYVDKTMELKVVKINQEFRNVVVSHKALIKKELEKQRTEIISKLEVGQILEGTVKNITSYGVFIDLGGVDGLVHITDLSWGRINHPEEMVQLDQKLKVVILSFDDEKKRIALGVKQLTEHPWDNLTEALEVGQEIEGKVVVIADYGAFVEIAPGVEGLIHVSEMSWSQHLHTTQDFLKVGDMVKAKILTLDKEERKISMGIKQLTPDPWEQIETKYAEGSKHTAKVRNFTNFGIFVEVEEGIDGLVHISDLSWTKKIKHPSEFAKVGEEIEVMVLSVDKDNRRLSFGHKQLEENPWDTFKTIFTEGSIHEGTIIKVFDKGALISLPYGVEGFTTPKHLTKQDKTAAKLDEKLPFKIIEFNKEAKKIIVSHSRTFEDLKPTFSKGKMKNVEQKAKNNMVFANEKKATLGDIKGLADLKSRMEEDKKEKPAAKKTPLEEKKDVLKSSEEKLPKKDDEIPK